jgi:hypothetical protein
MSFFEIGMLICFGAAWPFSIYKTIRYKRVDGKSAPFLIIVLLGYLSGIAHKALYSFDAVIYLYIVNAIMVIIDTSLYFAYRTKK